MIVSLQLRGQRVLIIGSSKEATTRAKSLADEGATVILYSARIQAQPDERIKLVQKERPPIKALFSARVVIATDRDPKINSWLFRRKSVCGFLLNTLDEKETCDFYHMSTRTPHPGITLAVSTSGGSPSFARSLANRLASSITPTDILVFERIVQMRQTMKAKGQSSFHCDWPEVERMLRSRLEELELSQKAS
jgi:siroheme synthase-like protein